MGSSLRRPNDFPLWETQVIDDLGGTPTTSKLVVLNWLAGAEGMPAAAHNPLAITENYSGEWGTTGTDPLIKNEVISPGLWNTSGVVTYATEQQGAAATAQFISHGHPGLEAALASTNPTPQVIVKSIVKDGAWGPRDNATLLSDAKLSSAGQSTPIYTGGAATGGAAGVMCSGKGDILDIPSLPVLFGSTPKINIFTYCNLKAIAGGLSIGLGIVTLFVGIGVLVQTPRVKSGSRGLKAGARAGISPINAAAKSGVKFLKGGE